MSAGSHGHFGGSESRNGGAEAGQAKRRLFGVLRRLVSTPQMFLKENNLKDEDSENDPLVSCWAHFYFVFVFHPASRYLLSSSSVQALGYVVKGVGSSSALVLITWPSLGFIFPVRKRKESTRQPSTRSF